jgi:hypothetical protein
LDAAAVIVDGAAVGFFLGDFGFFGSRLLRFCPLATSFPLLREASPTFFVPAPATAE